MATETDFVQLWIFLLTICPGLTSAAGAGLQILLVTGISYRYTYTFLKKKALNQKRNDYTRWQCYSKYILKIEGGSKSFFYKRSLAMPLSIWTKTYKGNRLYILSLSWFPIPVLRWTWASRQCPSPLTGWIP